jgi:hypothetical protein
MELRDLSMKPNFAEMSTKELRAYVLAHREDIEALEVLFSGRTPDSEATIYPSMFTEDGKPIEENHRIIEEAIAFSVPEAYRAENTATKKSKLSGSGSGSGRVR